MNEKSIKNNMVIHTNNELYNLSPNQIIYITADGNYSTFHLISGELPVITCQLGKIVELIKEQLSFSQNTLIRVGRGLIVNVDYVVYIGLQRNSITMDNGRGGHVMLPASRNALKELMNFIISKKEGACASQSLGQAIPFANGLPHAASFNTCRHSGDWPKGVLRKSSRKIVEFSDDDIEVLCGDD